jgi:dipeptidyl aminopeptidase/acylaminoacyl peptidase
MPSWCLICLIQYRLDLNLKWGIVDVHDVCDGAKYCVDQGWVDGDALCIDGGSAGGYTTLAALTFEDTFRVGASLYGISDLSALAAETHKFESRYCDMLIGRYPEEKAIYEDRSPIRYCDKLNCPVVLLQGLEDKVVPPNQADMMYSALHQKNIPTSLVLYKGEQHGFRMSKNIRHALHAEYSFFCQILGYQVQPEEGVVDIEIGSKVEV